MRSMKIRTAAALVAVTTASLAGAFGATPAGAENFITANTAPTLASPAFTMPGVQTAFEPDAAASDEIYTYAVTVGDAETLNDLDTVSACLYHSLKEDGVTVGEGDSTCTTINPQNTVKLTWTRSTNVFSISAGASTFWALGTAANVSVAPTDLTLTSGVVTFKFTVSEAMREGTWKAAATATDITAATATDSTQTKLVNAYSAITARVQQTFGTLAAGAAATATASPTVTSNGATTVSLTGGNFVNGAYSFALLTTGLTSVAPAAGQVTYDCMTGGTFTEASATRVGSTATSLGTATSTGTAENGSAVGNTCRIKHGGQRPVGTYSFTVVNAITNA